MFSFEDRCIYHRSPLVEVICQLRFPVILSIDSQPPYQFQEAIRGDYPQFVQRQDNLPPKPVNGKMVPQGTQPNYQFVDKDSHWKVNLSKNFISRRITIPVGKTLPSGWIRSWRRLSGCISLLILSGWACVLSTPSPARPWSWRQRPGGI